MDPAQAAILPVVFALGLRHGLDADHLAAIDGFVRLRPSPYSGALFALGHGGVVTLLAVGAHRLVGAADLGWLSPWLFLLVAAANLWRLLRPGTHAHQIAAPLLKLGPLALGVLLAVGFETVTQLTALSLANSVHPLLLGAAFTLGMLVTDGLNGVLAARVQLAPGPRAQVASRMIGWLVVIMTGGFAAGQFAGAELGEIALPLGAAVFAALVALRVWSLRDPLAVRVAP